ncbi:MAG TPA: hypothetical protein VFJ09_13050 [Nocardioidaceae bacterium]|nr:hypothetical protein [Nocardioidaceae bacterium]
MTDSKIPWSGWDRAGALCGAAYIVMINVGNTLQTAGSTDPHPSGAADLAGFGGHPSVTQSIGFGLEFTGMLSFLVFLGWFAWFLRSRGGPAPWLSSVAGLAGGVTIAVKLASVMPMGAGDLDHAVLTPALARVLADMNGAAFVLTFLPFGVFMLATGLAILSSRALGRIAGWTAVVIGAAGVVLTLATGVDPVATNALPFMLGMLWVLVVAIRLGVRPPRPVPDAAVGSELAAA